ncbi:MAG: hypothetical protein V7K26_00080 [Nostoc sp.]|uniref:hypothetical protein n=1 Tax=Nostoc sp. TaxID=1180 RepID=UPI002FF1E154
MTLPANFDEWEYLQDTVRRWHNKAVDKWFAGQPDNDVSSPKPGLKHACKMKDQDTANMTMMRLWLFEVTAGHAQSLQAPIYGIPVQEHQRNVKYKPQIKLYFKEKLTTNTNNRTSPATGEITFRLMDETSASMNESKAKVLALKIKNEFADPIFIWEKGWYKYTYLDTANGYDLRLFVKNKIEGIRITKQVLKIRSDTFNDDYGNYTDHERTYSLNPGNQIVYGQSVQKPVERPMVDVRFQYAQLFLHGRIATINLVAVANSGLKSVFERVNKI